MDRPKRSCSRRAGVHVPACRAMPNFPDHSWPVSGRVDYRGKVHRLWSKRNSLIAAFQRYFRSETVLNIVANIICTVAALRKRRMAGHRADQRGSPERQRRAAHQRAGASAGLSGMKESNWSGKEDSNLRPLPPEDVSPALLRWFYVGLRRKRALFDGLCSRLIPGNGSYRTLEHCLSGRRYFARRSSSRSTASRMKAERSSPSPRDASTRASRAGAHRIGTMTVFSPVPPSGFRPMAGAVAEQFSCANSYIPTCAIPYRRYW